MISPQVSSTVGRGERAGAAHGDAARARRVHVDRRVRHAGGDEQLEVGQRGEPRGGERGALAHRHDRPRSRRAGRAATPSLEMWSWKTVSSTPSRERLPRPEVARDAPGSRRALRPGRACVGSLRRLLSNSGAPSVLLSRHAGRRGRDAHRARVLAATLLAPAAAQAAPPTNDDRGSAQAPRRVPSTVRGTTVDATNEANEPPGRARGSRTARSGTRCPAPPRRATSCSSSMPRATSTPPWTCSAATARSSARSTCGQHRTAAAG